MVIGYVGYIVNILPIRSISQHYVGLFITIHYNYVKKILNILKLKLEYVLYLNSEFVFFKKINVL